MEFGYWAMKGRCHYIRWLVAYLAEDWLEYNPASFEEWEKVKDRLISLSPLVTLPYCLEDGVLVSES